MIDVFEYGCFPNKTNTFITLRYRTYFYSVSQSLALFFELSYTTIALIESFTIIYNLVKNNILYKFLNHIF